MNFFSLRRVGVMVLLLLVSYNLNSWATDGYLSLAYGTRAKGLAGAGSAYYPVSIVANNPAGNAFLGTHYTVGLALFNPSREFTVTGNPSGMPGTFGLTPGTVKSDSKVFAVPNMAGNWGIREKNAIGLSIYGNGGMNTNYPAKVFYGSADATGVNLSQMFTELTYAREIFAGHSVGVSLVGAYQMFKAEGFSTFGEFGMSADPENLSDNGTDHSFGVGFKAGYQGTLYKGLTIGGFYQSNIWMTEFDDYAGLFAEQGDFDIPMNFTVGLAYTQPDKFAVMADFKRIYYSKVNSVANPLDPMALPPAFLNPGGNPENPEDYTPNPNYTPLGSDNGSGFGWKDMNVIKVGAEYLGLEGWIFRAGYSWGKQPIPASEVLFNIVAPGVMEHHMALGLTKIVGKCNTEINFGFNYAFRNTVSGPNPMDFDPEEAQMGNLVPNQWIDLSMRQLDFEIGVTF